MDAVDMFIKVALRALEEADSPMAEEDLLAEVDVDAVRGAFGAPFLAIDGNPLFPDPVQQAAVLAARISRLLGLPHGIARATALLFADIRLQEAGLELYAPAPEIEAVFTAVSEHRVSDDALITWFARRTRRLRTPT